jgi:ABC-2 type transport system permease protein
MHKFWLVAKHEYLKTVSRRAFWLGTLGIPALIVVIMAVSIVISVGSVSDKPVGYVDDAGILEAAVYPELEEGEEFTQMRAFPDEKSAIAALVEAKEIEAFYVVPADYLQSPEVTLYYWEDWPAEAVRDDFEEFMQANLAAGLPAEVQQRVLQGVDLTVQSADGRREIAQKNFLSLIMPFIAGIFFVFAVMTSAGYLLQAVTDEKENRTVEIVVTSLTPEQLIGGKAAGLIAVALSQILVWALAVVVALIVGAQFLEPLQAVRVPWGFLLVIILYFFPAFCLIAGLMTAIGGMVTEMQQGQQIAGVLNMLFILPFFFVGLAFFDPDSPILVALTLFPTTAFITVAVRWGMTVIPVWQLLVSWLLLVATAGFSVWASARIFRAGMLRYGQRISLRGAIQILRTRRL